MNKWYSGTNALTKTCPSCRTEHGHSDIFVLRGIDVFLLKMKVMDCKSKVDDTESETEELLIATLHKTIMYILRFMIRMLLLHCLC